MDNDAARDNFEMAISDSIAGTVSPAITYARWIGYAEGVDAAQADDFNPADYDAEDLFARYFG